MFRRTPKQKHRDQMRGELAESIDHLRTATMHAAAGAKEKVGPAVDNALLAAGLRKRPRRRWPWIAGTAVVMSAAGAAGFAMWRRNNARAIDEELFADEPDPKHSDLTYPPHSMESRPGAMASASAD